MKKVVFTLAAVASLGLAACEPAADDAANNTADLEATENEADLDVNLAAGEAAASNALDDLGNAASDAGNTIENAASDVGNAAENATN